MKKNIASSDLHPGPVRHPTLPGVFIDRIKAFKTILADVDTVSLEKTIDAFTRDRYPEAELVIWERIANTFQIFLEDNPLIHSQAARKELYAVIVGASMGRERWTTLKHLTQAQSKQIVMNYRGGN